MRLTSFLLPRKTTTTINPSTGAGNLGLLFLAALSFVPAIRALSFTSVPSPNLDLSQLGRIALGGNFDSVSLYNYVGQNEDSSSTNGSQSILGRYPMGTFASLESADASIESMCSFVRKNGTLVGVMVGGNYTSLGGKEVQGMAIYHPAMDTVEPLQGLTGQVYTVLCDNEEEKVYVGGSFTGANSTNALVWNGAWENLPFAGFNGPVSSIAKLRNGNILFGGTFTGTGNLSSPAVANAQVINVGSANITAQGTTTNSDYDDPRNIVCKTSNQTGAGNEWLLANGTAGYWGADFGFGFVPTKLRLYNSQVSGYATRTWRFVDQNSGGIMNFTYYGDNGLASCTAQCPLALNASHQDFYFVNYVGMNAFRIYVSDWYGLGGGLGGIELFENDIYAFAVQAFNEPRCESVSPIPANATNTGPWHIAPSSLSTSDYLTATLANGTLSGSNLSVVFRPDIVQSGNYSVTMYTPGCIADDTCSTRGIVNVTSHMGSASSTASKPVSVEIYQTNNNDKYDEIYYGYVDATESSFRPSVTLTPSPGQSGPLTVVAQRVRFQLISSTGGLNGLYEFNPNGSTINSDFSASTFDYAGMQLNAGAQIYSLATDNNATFAAGSFSSNTSSNVISIANGNSTSLPGGGLDRPVQTLFLNGSYLYAAGNFTNTRDSNTNGLNGVASYSIAEGAWEPLGAGVNGIVYNIVPIPINMSSTFVEDCLAFSGYFDEVYGFDNYSSFTVDNIAVWVPSQKNWLHNLDTDTISLTGRLTTQVEVPNVGQLFAGAVDAAMLGESGAVALSTTGTLALERLPIHIEPSTPSSTSSSSTRKRAVDREEVRGVVTGLYYVENGLNITVLAGRFTATATNGSTVANLAFINGTDNDRVTGLLNNSASDTAFLAVATQGPLLFAGGSGTDGVVLYDLAAAQLSSSQPPALSGDTATVNAIATRPSTSAVYVGGSFTSAGSLSCPALCIYNTLSQQWNMPGSGLSASSVITALKWATSDHLIITGNLSIGGNYTTMTTYDVQAQSFTNFPGAGNLAFIPGQISAFTATDSTYTSFFAAGTSSSTNTVFLTHFDGSNSTWTSISGLSSASVVEGLQVLGLTANHATSTLLSADQVLLITGQLQLPQYGNVSAALFNGTTFTPFLLSTLDDGSPGSVRGVFVQNTQNLLSSNNSHLATGFVVLIALAIALALIFLLVVAGIILQSIRRRREGYVPAPTDLPPHMMPQDKTQ